MISPQQQMSQEIDRAGWTTIRDQFLIESLIKQAKDGKKTDVGFVRDAWKSVLVCFNRKFKLNYTIVQLKSRYKKLKIEYNMLKMLQSQEGFGWNETMKVITADEDVWEQYIAAHPNARNYKNKCFPLYCLCGVLFDGKVADDFGAISMLQNELLPVANTANNNESDQFADMKPDHVNGFVDKDEPLSEDSIPYAIPSEVLDTKHRDTTSSTRRGKRLRSSPGHRIAAALENIAYEFSDGQSTHKVSSEDDVPYQRCISELQNMEGLDPSDCVKAASILREPLNRVAFMTFSEDLRSLWLRRELDQLS